MYGYIDDNGIVGELFDRMPPKEQYHEAYRAGIAKLPKHVGPGWKRCGKTWLGPHEAGREAAAAAARRERSHRLDRCDIVYCNAASWELMDADGKASWHVYKQRLRELPEQDGFPYEIEWPKQPGETDA